jgi:signal transduction histidine kinase
MSFRRKLLIVFPLTVLLPVIGVSWIVSALARRALEENSEKSTTVLVAQLHREFDRQGEDIVQRLDAIAASDAALRMAVALGPGTPDYAKYLNEAKTIAGNQQLDFLEFVDNQRTIISSAQWPAKFGYKEPSLPSSVPKNAFLQQEDLPEGSALGLIAVREIDAGDKPLYVIGGRRLDKAFLSALELPPGMQAFLYQNVSNGFQAANLMNAGGNFANPAVLAPLIQQVQQKQQEMTQVVRISNNAADDESFHAFPLAGENNQVLGILLVGTSRRPYIELRRQIRSAALLAGAGGLLLAVLLSGWAAARVTRPVEQLANAAREVAAGNWNAQVNVTSSDELGELAEAFNRMTRELLDHKERLVQAERVAAWRELARRLAHELKNPLFPLQLTVENLLRARQQTPQQFEEILNESSSTLLAEIANLKAIISRFGEFSKMPQPQFQRVQINDLMQNCSRLFGAQFQSGDRAKIECRLELAGNLPEIAADPELLHRALSNLILNAMDAMPQGGTLTLRTGAEEEKVSIEISDTGAGLTPEECERLFTPYYTTKTHGTGLGLAVVQSVISDHGGKISVHSQAGQGTTFRIELPCNSGKLGQAFGNDTAES